MVDLKGIEGWEPGLLLPRPYAGADRAWEMYLAELAGQTFGTLALQWSDEEV